MIELHVVGNNLKDLEASRKHCLTALHETMENWDCIITEVFKSSDPKYEKTNTEAIKSKYVFIIQIGMNDLPTIRYRIDDRKGFMDWFPNPKDPMILHDI